MSSSSHPTDAQAYCTNYTKTSGSNFYYSFLFLPKQKREAMYTIYTLCRMIDCDVDEPSTGTDPLQAITQWRKEVAATYRGKPTRPVTMSLAEHLKTFDIPEDLIQELISGVEMDLTINRYETFTDLYQYCYRVASVVGLICLKIFKTQSSDAEQYAINLGMAFQLTNILRDLQTDAQQNRVYLPQEDFRRFHCSEEHIFQRQSSPELTHMLQFECQRAHTYYQQAKDTLLSLPLRDQHALVVPEIMRGVYSKILQKFEEHHYPISGPRIRIPSIQRLGIATKIWLRSQFLGRFAHSM